MEYQKVINDLSKSINQKGLNDLFLNSLKVLKLNFGVEVSTKFLRGLSEINDFRKKTYRISYLLRSQGLKTKRTFRFFKRWDLNKYNTEVIEYGINKKGEVFIKDLRHQDIGNLFIGNHREIVYIIKI